ncbi:hypothetical protein C9I57_24080 [Trinickia symbiotica]|uniref:HEPN AbiU2-like domain-containing protein n=1 Tax=Trinickia symbiotica TaxID=863227 RepID=A0A2T3XP10_9BURK|nr:hypothetical protein [Trinickia symbiotica]PTB18261.1 hypothetical protein C9I57_24080 [Trinickia symbiotica]
MQDRTATNTQRSSATIEERLQGVKSAVEAAQDEAILAVQFHETWRPTIADADLRRRMGHSFATHSFHIIRMALRREVLLALMRLWDKDSRAVKVTGIAELLRDKAFFDELVRERASRIGFRFDVTESMRDTLEPKRDQILALVRKYTHGKERPTLLERLTTLRHEQLAHRQTREPTDPAELQHTDEEVEEFYQDTLEIVGLMLSVFLGRAFDIAGDAKDVFQHHAKFFWAAARGERTAGHPFFKPRPE